MSKPKITLLALSLGLAAIFAFNFVQQKNTTDQDIDTSESNTAQEKPMTLIEIKAVPAPIDSISR